MGERERERERELDGGCGRLLSPCSDSPEVGGEERELSNGPSASLLVTLSLLTHELCTWQREAEGAWLPLANSSNPMWALGRSTIRSRQPMLLVSTFIFCFIFENRKVNMKLWMRLFIHKFTTYSFNKMFDEFWKIILLWVMKILVL